MCKLLLNGFQWRQSSSYWIHIYLELARIFLIVFSPTGSISTHVSTTTNMSLQHVQQVAQTQVSADSMSVCSLGLGFSEIMITVIFFLKLTLWCALLTLCSLVVWVVKLLSWLWLWFWFWQWTVLWPVPSPFFFFFSEMDSGWLFFSDFSFSVFCLTGLAVCQLVVHCCVSSHSHVLTTNSHPWLTIQSKPTKSPQRVSIDVFMVTTL